jgi:hypothetical protein
MDDRQRLEEHALRRDRLVGMLLHGAAWRERPDRDAARRLLTGLLIGIVVCALVAAGSFVSRELGQARDPGRVVRTR